MTFYLKVWVLCMLISSIIFRENKELKARQAKVSVDTAKEVAQDKTLRNKAEKDRRLREKNQNNTKKFIEERKMTAMRQNKESEKLKKQHEQEMQDLSRDIKLVSAGRSLERDPDFCFLFSVLASPRKYTDFFGAF